METNDGKKPCTRCGGSGRVPVASPIQKVSHYCGPNGETHPHENCEACGGSGWKRQPLANPNR